MQKFQDLNFSELARDLDLSPSYVYLILNGKRNPKLDVARKLAGRIGVTMEQLAEHMESRQQAQAA